MQEIIAEHYLRQRARKGKEEREGAKESGFCHLHFLSHFSSPPSPFATTPALVTLRQRTLLFPSTALTRQLRRLRELQVALLQRLRHQRFSYESGRARTDGPTDRQSLSGVSTQVRDDSASIRPQLA